MRQLKISKSITNRESASLDKYLQEIGREDLISVEEEVELAQRIRNGDQRALDKLTRANLRFVVSVAKQYQHQGFMREMMEFVYAHAQQYGIMVALETDDILKAKKYEHLGMILYRTRNCGHGYHVYNMIR